MGRECRESDALLVETEIQSLGGSPAGRRSESQKAGRAALGACIRESGLRGPSGNCIFCSIAYFIILEAVSLKICNYDS